MRILISGIGAGIVVFAWGAFSHMVLPLGGVGIQTLPNEEAVVTAIRQGIQKPGFYFFPGMAETPGASKQQREASMRAWEEKYRQGPSGILVVTPGGREPMSMRQLGSELITNILGAVLAAILLSMAGVASFGGRVFFVTLLGLFASLAVDLSHWTWYGFPTDFTLAALTDQVLGWFCGGLALAWMVKPGPR